VIDARAGAPAGAAPAREGARTRRVVTIAMWLGSAILVVGILGLLGIDITGWLGDVWDSLTGIAVGYLVAGFALQTVQTTMTAVGWFFILAAAFPRERLAYRAVLASYAAGVALNGFLPANIGTVVMLLMFVALIPAATFSGILGSMIVQKIFFTAVGTFVYLYLFLSVPGSFDLQLGGLHDHPAAVLLIVVGGALLLAALGRRFWQRVKAFWARAKEGGAILARPRDYALKVVAPSAVAWLAKLGVTGVFLAAYGIPVTFHTVMSVIGGNSLANTVSATPGGVGINQAVNAAALTNVTDASTATAYSIGQQLAVTAWNVVFALAVVVWAFGWSGGKTLVESSYEDAKVKVAEQKAERAARKQERKQARREREA
jgi:uncharacterized membrane protein YbhN (UPF0104 family)